MGQESALNPKDFLFAFCSNWQLELLRQYSSVMCLDSTHNTCCALESNHGAFLHSIVIKHDDAGCGIPVAFMVTNSENMVPLEMWLRQLKESVPFNHTPIFMIDCSRTEVAAIKAVFPNPSIRYCHWHFFRVLTSQVTKKIKLSSDRKSAISDFRALLWTKTQSDFQTKWEAYMEKYKLHPEWINYLRSQWMNDVDKWWNGYRMVRPIPLDVANNIY